MSDGITISSARFDAAIVRLLTTSKRAAVDVMKQQAKLLFVEVAKVTPPNHDSTTGKAAERNAMAKLNADQHAIYGTPNRAYDDLKAKNAGAAAGFWQHYKSGDISDAAVIVRKELGKSFTQFDGGKVGHSFLGKRKRSKREVVFYLTNPASLDLHIQELRQHIWWLASGWAPALRALGAKLPYGVGKLTSPGTLHVIVNAQRIEITMINHVRFGPQVKDIQRRIDFAMKVRVGALDRMWKTYLARLSRTL